VVLKRWSPRLTAWGESALDCELAERKEIAGEFELIPCKGLDDGLLEILWNHEPGGKPAGLGVTDGVILRTIPADGEAEVSLPASNC